MLLPRRAAWVIGAGAFALFLSLMVLESGAVLPNVALTGVSAVVGIDTYGESAPAPVLFKHFGFTPENVADTVQAVLAKK